MVEPYLCVYRFSISSIPIHLLAFSRETGRKMRVYPIVREMIFKYLIA